VEPQKPLGLGVPDGEYTCRLVGVTPGPKEYAEKVILQWEIEDDDYKGQRVSSAYGQTTETGVAIFKRDLQVLGVNASPGTSYTAAMAALHLKVGVLARVRVATGKRGFQGLRPMRLVEEADLPELGKELPF